MGVFAEVEAFVQAHHPCGDISWLTSPPTASGYRVRMTCLCGAVLDRWVTAEMAERDLLLSRLTAFPD